MKAMKEHLAHFHVAGFTFYDGVDVFNKLKVGKKVKLTLEEDNKWDPRAVAIYFKGQKIGFVPRSENRIFYKLMKVGITQFEARIQKIDPQEHTERQVEIVVHLLPLEQTY
ncbi:MAG: DNA-binding protein [Chryseobacterium sp. SCN 40-13]|nr:MAG: DNA-binding protein [Chryseobacterium sp. SCN 40-13]